MRKKVIITLTSMSILSLMFSSCSNNLKDVDSSIDVNNLKEISSSMGDDKEVSSVSDTNKNESKVSFDDNIPVTPLFKDIFLKFIDKVGINSFDEDKAMVESLSEYNIEITPPTEYILGKFKISDDKGDYVSLCYLPLNNKEILTLITYNRNGYEISISNDMHKSTELQYITYDINATDKNKVVSNINELANFMFVEIGDASSKTNEKLEVFIDIKPIVHDGKVIFDIGTNLPNGTQLMVDLSGNDYYGQTKVIVENGTITTEAFSNKGQALLSGNYKVEVSMPLPAIQSNSVRNVIGNTGENMIGELVEKSSIGDSYVVEKEMDFSL